MLMEENLTAHVTGDGYVRRLGVAVPRDYGRSVTAEIIVPMTGREIRLARGLNNAEIRLTIRSALAQLGLDGGLIDETTIMMKSDHAFVTTELTEWHESPVIDAIANVSREHIRVSVGRLALLPGSARASYHEFQDAIPFDHLRHEDDRIGIPLGVDTYHYDGGHLRRIEVEQILKSPSAREALAKHRQTNPSAEFDPLQYFHLASMRVDSPRYHIALRNEVLKHHKLITTARHGNAMLLDAGRTMGERQAELFGQLPNFGHKPNEYALLADVYRAEEPDPNGPVS